ncbi:unnamed protein product [Closterium sp. NIES-64]|nr:unnamed protein product [Closterium sp. NIES-64]
MPRLNRREQLPLHIKRALCAHHVEHPLLRHVDLARWVYAQYGLRPDRSTVGRILKNASRWAITDPAAANQVRRRGGAWPELEQAMARWIANAGPAGVPLTLQTIRDHVAIMARNMGIPPVFRCSIGWVRHALRRQGVRCRAATGEAASADMAAVREAREKVPALLTHLGYQPRDTFNLDETALWLSVLPRKTYSNARIPGRKVSKERLTVAFLVNADGSHVFRPLVISKARRPHDFRPDYDPEAVCYWWHNAKGWMTSALTHVYDDEPTPHAYPDIELDDDIDGVGELIGGLGLGTGAMTAAEYVAIDEGEPTCAEAVAGATPDDADVGLVAELWRAPTNMQAVLFLHWNITDAKDGIIAALEAKKGSGGEKGWLSVGWSGGKPGRRMMFPSDVVVGNHVVGSTAVKLTDVLAYSMTKDSLSGIKRATAVILSDTSVVSVGGGRIIKFTRKGAGGVASQAVSYESGVTTTMIWAFSTTSAFKTHTKKGAFSVNLGCTV